MKKIEVETSSVEQELNVARAVIEEVERKVRKVKETSLVESLVEALEGLDAVKSDIRQLQNLRENYDALVRAINDLTVQVNAEISSRDVQRSKENELLDQLKTYIANWR